MDLGRALEIDEIVAAAQVLEKATRHELSLARVTEPQEALEEDVSSRLNLILERIGALRRRAKAALDGVDPQHAKSADLRTAMESLEIAGRSLFTRLAHLQLSARDETKAVEKYRAVSIQLRQMRLESGLTMEELAEQIGATKNIVNHVENGRRTTTLDILTRWAMACGYHLEFSVYKDHEDFVIESSEHISELKRVAAELSLRDIRFLRSIADMFTTRGDKGHQIVLEHLRYLVEHRLEPLHLERTMVKRVQKDGLTPTEQDRLYQMAASYIQEEEKEHFDDNKFPETRKPIESREDEDIPF